MIKEINLDYQNINELENDFNNIIITKCKFSYEILYINLKSAIERRNRIQFYMDILKLKFNRFDAVNGYIYKSNNDFLIKNNLIKKESLNLIDKIKHKTFLLNYPSIGIALSNYYIYKKIINDNQPKLILEDDIFIRSNFIHSLNDCFDFLHNNDIDMIFLGVHHYREINWETTNNINFRKLKKNKSVYGLYSYIITPSGAKKLLKLFPLKYQIDREISNNSNSMNIFRYCPASVYSFPSQMKFSNEKKFLNTSIQHFNNIEYFNNNNNNKSKYKNILIIIIIIIFLIIILYLIK